VVTDAVSLEGLSSPVIAEIGSDGRYCCVAAAAILAKVERDQLMDRLARDFPGFGWERNRGYGVAEHRAALARIGPSAQHRKSFAPVRVLA
jgi:ribonuclease HII